MEISTSLDILSKIITSKENVSKLQGCNFIRWWRPLHSWGGTDRCTFITNWALLSQSRKERNVCNASILLFRFLRTVSILPFSFADKLLPFSLFFFCGKPFFFLPKLQRRRGRATKVRAEPSMMQTNPAQQFQQSNQSTLNSLPAGLPFTTRLTRFPVTISYKRPPVTRLTRFPVTRLTRFPVTTSYNCLPVTRRLTRFPVTTDHQLQQG